MSVLCLAFARARQVQCRRNSSKRGRLGKRLGQLPYAIQGRAAGMIALVVCFAMTSLAPLAWGRVLCRERDGRQRIEGPLERQACCKSAVHTGENGAAPHGWNDRCCIDTVIGGEWDAVFRHGAERIVLSPPQFLPMAFVFVPDPPERVAFPRSLSAISARPPTSTVVLLI